MIVATDLDFISLSSLLARRVSLRSQQRGQYREAAWQECLFLTRVLRANADILAERSGRWPSHPTRSQRAGSNPAGVHPLAIADVNSPAAREHRCAALAARGDAPLPSEVKSGGVEPSSFLSLSLHCDWCCNHMNNSGSRSHMTLCPSG